MPNQQDDFIKIMKPQEDLAFLIREEENDDSRQILQKEKIMTTNSGSIERVLETEQENTESSVDDPLKLAPHAFSERKPNQDL